MFENSRRGRQARNFTADVPKILDLKSSSEQIFSENWRWVPRYQCALLFINKGNVNIYLWHNENNLRKWNATIDWTYCSGPILLAPRPTQMAWKFNTDRTKQMQARLEKHILFVCVLVYILITSRSPKRACSKGPIILRRLESEKY